MKVTRQMLHEDLQPASVYGLQMVAKTLLQYEWSAKILNRLFSKTLAGDVPDSISIEEQFLPTSDGESSIRVKIYRPKDAAGNLPAMLYTHGGGYIIGTPDAHDGMMADFIECRPCVIVAPAYRTAFVKPYPAAFDDCYMTLLWMRDNAEELGVDASKVMIAGHSAGGGLTAAVTLKARDTGDVNVAFQMPFYPMIDDQQPDDPARDIDVPGWDTRTNAFGWASYLKDLRDHQAEIPAYAAPARNTDYSDFPPTVTFVGELEPFYWETVEYVQHLKAAGVDVAFKVYEKCSHGFELIAPDSPIGRDGTKFTFDNYAAFYDRYIKIESGNKSAGVNQ